MSYEMMKALQTLAALKNITLNTVGDFAIFTNKIKGALL